MKVTSLILLLTTALLGSTGCHSLGLPTLDETEEQLDHANWGSLQRQNQQQNFNQNQTQNQQQNQSENDQFYTPQKPNYVQPSQSPDQPIVQPVSTPQTINCRTVYGPGFDQNGNRPLITQCQ